MLTVKSSGIEINYDDIGQGEPALLFLPGWCGSRTVFERLVAECAKHRRCLVLDWRGHGQSGQADGDFGVGDLVDDALAVIGASRAEHIVPIALSHAGWIAIELSRRLGARIPKLVLLDWIVLDAPPPLFAALQALQDPAQWQSAREQLFSMWLHGLDILELTRYVHNDMGAYPFEMWARAGREINAAYAKFGNPLLALSTLNPQAAVLHLYAQPEDSRYFDAQQAFADAHPWFRVFKLKARSHFPMLEVPGEMATIIERFVG